MRDCCLFVRGGTKPPSPKTGFSHPDCYARELQDCDKQLTGEHYFSKSVLLSMKGDNIRVSGLPWTDVGEERRVSVNSLTGRILCKRHNSALSPLDDIASKFFGFYTAEWTDDWGQDFCLVRGYDLERWQLKTLCGLVASGNATLNGKRLQNWTPPREWLDILFGDADIEAPAGLHFVFAPQYSARNNVIDLKPAFKTDTGEPIALAVSMVGLIAMLAMEELPPARAPSKTGAKTAYRLKALRLCREEQFREAHFGWPEGKFISLIMNDPS